MVDLAGYRGVRITISEGWEHLAGEHPNAVDGGFMAQKARLSGHQEVPETTDAFVELFELTEHLVGSSSDVISQFDRSIDAGRLWIT